MREHLPILIELVLVFGGALAFTWWQLRDVARAQQRTRAEREAARRAAETQAVPAASTDRAAAPSPSPPAQMPVPTPSPSPPAQSR
ncbi:MAG: hypothetical protein MUC68_01820 [Burkholderiaceae bacterium]|nr:hypothetical protein [Burkholderiaceae bacterium]